MKAGSSLKDHEVKVNNKVFRSFNAACRYYNVNINTGNRRKELGWSLEDIFKGKRTKIAKYTVRGKEFSSMFDLAAYYKCERTTVKKRLNNGWTLEEALELTNRKATVKCSGKLYVIKNTINKKRYYGITTQNLSHRFNKHKQEALNKVDRKLYKAMRKYGVQNFYIELVKEADNRTRLRRLEIKYITHYNTVEKGYNTLLGGGHLGDRFGKTVVCEGVKYPSISSLAGYLGMNIGTLQYRIKHGLNIHTKDLRIKSSPALVN